MTAGPEASFGGVHRLAVEARENGARTGRHAVDWITQWGLTHQDIFCFPTQMAILSVCVERASDGSDQVRSGGGERK